MNQGLSLAEVILALGLLTLVVLVLMAVFVGGARSLQQSERLAAAAALAKAQIDAVRRSPWSDLSLPLVFDARLAQPAINGFPPAPYPGTESEKLRLELAPDPSGLVRLRVRVYWGQRGLLAQEVLLKP